MLPYWLSDSTGSSADEDLTPQPPPGSTVWVHTSPPPRPPPPAARSTFSWADTRFYIPGRMQMLVTDKPFVYHYCSSIPAQHCLPCTQQWSCWFSMYLSLVHPEVSPSCVNPLDTFSYIMCSVIFFCPKKKNLSGAFWPDAQLSSWALPFTSRLSISFPSVLGWSPFLRC